MSKKFPTVLDKVSKKDVILEPFPHILVKNVLPEDIVSKLKKTYPGLQTTTKGKNYQPNQRHSFSAFDVSIDDNIAKIWKDFTKAHTSKEFLDRVTNLFGEAIKEKYPDFEKKYGNLKKLRAGVRNIDNFNKAEVLLDSQICVNTPVVKPSKVRGVHLDNPDKIYFGIYYLRPEGDTSRGSALQFYKYKKGVNPNVGQALFTPGKDIDDRFLDFLSSFEYQSNTLFLCINTLDALHGVSVRESTKNPRLFVNLLGIVKDDLFKIRRESKYHYFLRRYNLIKNLDSYKNTPTQYESGFFEKNMKSILFLNEKNLSEAYAEISPNFNILTLKDLNKLSKQDLGKVEGVLIGKGKHLIDKLLLKKLPNLQIVGIASGSLKKFNPELLIERDIKVINISETYAIAVAEYALMMSLVGIRNAHLSYSNIKKGKWDTIETKLIEKEKNLTKKVVKKTLKNNKLISYISSGIDSFHYFTFEKRGLNKPNLFNLSGSYNFNKNEYNASKKTLYGCRFGIVGYGHVSKKLIELLKPFKCEILINSEFLSDKQAKELGVIKSDLKEVLECDVVSIHRGLSDRTEKSIGEKEINMIKTGSVLVNTSRGKIIDEKALINRLKKKEITACLDVFSKEPLKKSNTLRKLPNVFLTSHIANSTDSIYSQAITDLAINVMKILKKEKFSNEFKNLKKIKNMS